MIINVILTYLNQASYSATGSIRRALLVTTANIFDNFHTLPELASGPRISSVDSAQDKFHRTFLFTRSRMSSLKNEGRRK